MTAPVQKRDDLQQNERDDVRLMHALRARDEAAFLAVLDQRHASLLRFASIYLSNAEARKLVQEFWLALVDALVEFDGQEAFKVWLHQRLLERIRARRSAGSGGVLRRLGLGRAPAAIPYARSWSLARAPAVAAVEPERFFPASHEDGGAWARPPSPFRARQRTAVRDRERVLHAVEGLPPAEREVVTLRDIEGWNVAEVCNFLGVTETNQRTLLHRGRSAVRRALEQHFVEQNPHG